MGTDEGCILHFWIFDRGFESVNLAGAAQVAARQDHDRSLQRGTKLSRCSLQQRQQRLFAPTLMSWPLFILALPVRKQCTPQTKLVASCRPQPGSEQKTRQCKAVRILLYSMPKGGEGQKRGEAAQGNGSAPRWTLRQKSNAGHQDRSASEVRVSSCAELSCRSRGSRLAFKLRRSVPASLLAAFFLHFQAIQTSGSQWLERGCAPAYSDAKNDATNLAAVTRCKPSVGCVPVFLFLPWRAFCRDVMLMARSEHSIVEAPSLDLRGSW